ncbi:MAG: histidine kinase [Rhizobacter sp.]|nr:histidine kinase [Rhizobacter sp.]
MPDSTVTRETQRERWIGWRVRLLLGGALFGCLCVFMLARLLSESPSLAADFTSTPDGQLVVTGSRNPALAQKSGSVLLSVGVATADGVVDATPVNGLMLQRSSRWLVNDGERQRFIDWHEALVQRLAHDEVRLTFADGSDVDLAPTRLGLAHLGPLFWAMTCLGLLLYLWSLVSLTSSPRSRNVLYTVMAWCQIGNLLFIAVESTMGLCLPRGFAFWDMHARAAFDLCTAAAMAHASTLHPRKVPGLRGLVMAGWAVAAALIGLDLTDRLPHAWAFTQVGAGLLGALSIPVLTRSFQLVRHPFALVMRRVAVMVLCGWALLSVLVVMAPSTGREHVLAAGGSVAYYALLSITLMSLPFLYRSQRLFKEFALLAAISTAATVLDLVFLSMFAFGQFASITLALFLSLGAYAGAREWIVRQVLGSSMLTAERMFEHLYRAARAIEAEPAASATIVMGLLRQVFEPMTAQVVYEGRALASSRVVGSGSALVVPVPEIGSGSIDREPQPSTTAVVLRFARRGGRLFTLEDGHFADRLLGQLHSAVAFDKAVEQGRSEERLRLAQDLHDDIGARLLTLMYQAPTPEMEDYLRQTLGDLKTLTRGLASTDHRFSHAAGEWKADLTHRLSAARIELQWSVSVDDDPTLSVVQWSALTRILRELVSNTIAHARCTQAQVRLQLHQGTLSLAVIDNGPGSDPAGWAHGLGLGGVRKRVKQLGGEVSWTRVQPSGICCKVEVANWSPPITVAALAESTPFQAPISSASERGSTASGSRPDFAALGGEA